LERFINFNEVRTSVSTTMYRLGNIGAWISPSASNLLERLSRIALN